MKIVGRRQIRYTPSCLLHPLLSRPLRLQVLELERLLRPVVAPDEDRAFICVRLQPGLLHPTTDPTLLQLPETRHTMS